MDREFPDDGLRDGVVEDLLACNEIHLELRRSLTYSKFANVTQECISSTLGHDETLTLLYYGGYLTMTVCYFYPIVLSILISAKDNGRFRIPNQEVMTDWARWIIRKIESPGDILKACVEGPVSDFEAKWPDFMQQLLRPKLAINDRRANILSRKTPENVYRVFFIALMQSLGAEGSEVSVEARTGRGYVVLCLLHKRKRQAVLIELKPSEKEGDMEMDANKALEQIADPEGPPNINILRGYGMAVCHLNSFVKGRYLELDDQNQWVEKADPAVSVS